MAKLLSQTPEPAEGEEGDEAAATAAAKEAEVAAAAATAAAAAATSSLPQFPLHPSASLGPAGARPETLHFTLPPRSSDALTETLAVRAAYQDRAKLGHFQKPQQYAPFPSTQFEPEDVEVYGRIRSADQRDGREAESLWNVGYNLKVAISGVHQLADSLANGEVGSATEYLSVLSHFLEAGYSRLQERKDFFCYGAENGKSESILLDRYLRSEHQPFTSSLYKNTSKKFAEIRAVAFAKELNKTHAQSAGGGRPDKNSRDQQKKKQQ